MTGTVNTDQRGAHVGYAPGRWTDGAACATVDSEIFFPEQGGNPNPAKAVCRGCPVRAECLEFAINAPFLAEGIWGGTSAYERREMRRRNGIRTNNLPDVCGTEAGYKRHTRRGEQPCPSCRIAGNAAWARRRTK